MRIHATCLGTRLTWPRLGSAALIALVLAAWTGAPLRAETKEGVAKLQELTGFDIDKKALKVELGTHVKATCWCFINPNHFGKKAVEIRASIRNPSDETMYYGLYIAFFDKNKRLLGCGTIGGKAIFAKLAKGTSTANEHIELPTAMLSQIASYQITLVTDTKEFGQK